MIPLPTTSEPTHRYQTVNEAGYSPFSAVPHRTKIRHKAQKPEQNRDGKVGGDSKYIPKQRTPKIRPNPIRIGNGRQKPNHPDPSHVNRRENSSANNGKEC